MQLLQDVYGYAVVEIMPGRLQQSRPISPPPCDPRLFLLIYIERRTFIKHYNKPCFKRHFH